MPSGGRPSSRPRIDGARSRLGGASVQLMWPVRALVYASLVPPVDALDPSRLDRTYQYALAVARQLDDFAQRDLGPIHFLKYAYLADLAYAAGGGDTYTGTDWRFFHFGPWSAAAYARIEPALIAVSAKKKTLASKVADDFVRYSFDDEREAERLARHLEDHLPLSVAGTIVNAVRHHGSDTADLLRHVYLTPPMLRAKPGDLLTFDADLIAEPQEESVGFEKKVRRARRAAILAAREEVLKRLAARKQVSSPIPAPRYDEVFYEGTAQLDKLAGDSIAGSTGVVGFDESIWASEQRREPEIP